MQCRQPLWTICLHGNGKIMEFNTEGARCSSQDCLRGRSIITETAGLIIIHFLERWDKGECDQVLQRDRRYFSLRQQTNDLDLQNKWFTTRWDIFIFNYFQNQNFTGIESSLGTKNSMSTFIQMSRACFRVIEEKQLLSSTSSVSRLYIKMMGRWAQFKISCYQVFLYFYWSRFRIKN